jgi:hypothetical protein
MFYSVCSFPKKEQQDRGMLLLSPPIVWQDIDRSKLIFVK